MKSSRTLQFAALVRYYRQLHHSQEDELGVGTYRFTAMGAWATSRAPHLFFFFRQLGLDRYRLFLDLGSGDGIAACTAGLFTRAIGIEGDYGLCSMAQQASVDLGIQERVGFICGDYLTQSIEQADCIYMYPDKPFQRVERILKDWRGTLLIYGPHIPPSHFRSVSEFKCGKERMVVYRVRSEGRKELN